MREEGGRAHGSSEGSGKGLAEPTGWPPGHLDGSGMEAGVQGESTEISA